MIVSSISLILPNCVLHPFCPQLINLGTYLGAYLSSCLEIRGCVSSGYTMVFLGSSCLINSWSLVISKLRQQFATQEASPLQDLPQTDGEADAGPQRAVAAGLFSLNLALLVF